MKDKHRRSAIALFGALFAITISSCEPVQEAEPEEECFDANVNLVALTDEKFTAPVPEAEDIKQIMTAYLAPTNAPPGCAVGVVVNNKVYYLQGYGQADVASSTPYTHATMQGVGSISKTITALAVLKLVEQGHLASLDDPVTKYVLGPSFAGITIRELLSHSSGLPLWPDWAPTLNTEQELIQIWPQYAHPGINPRFVAWGYLSTPANQSSGVYSNAGYSLLGAVIDQITTSPSFPGRRGYEAYTWWNVALKEGIISGPTMISMCLDTYWREDDILNLATGYQQDGTTPFPNLVNPDGGPGGWRGPAGGWAMTIGDLSRLMIGINTNAFISEQLKEVEMLAADVQPAGGGAEHTFGLGVWKLDNLGRPTLMHGGNIDGFTARYTLWPEEGLGVALMCNREEAGAFRQRTNDIAELFLNGSGAVGSAAPDADLPAKRLVELILAQAREADSAARTRRGGAPPLAETDRRRRILRAVEAGDLGTAVALAKAMIEDLDRSRAEPSPISSGLNETL